MSSVLEQEALRVNEWRVARDGLNARIVDAVTGAEYDNVRAVLRRTLDVLHPIAQDLGDTDALSHVQTILERGTASDRMRMVWQQRNALTDITDWLQTETLVGTGIDRRHAQRAP
jgi:gamma-glutamyl:cysteine ligase YbdK (ATP-grasp superfamily)